jgi:hypothetical protein
MRGVRNRNSYAGLFDDSGSHVLAVVDIVLIHVYSIVHRCSGENLPQGGRDSTTKGFKKKKGPRAHRERVCAEIDVHTRLC